MARKTNPSPRRSREVKAMLISAAIAIGVLVAYFLVDWGRPTAPVDPPPENTDQPADAPYETEPPEPAIDALPEAPNPE